MRYDNTAVREKSPLRIFLSYFAAHKRLFALDITCAVLMAAIDLSFPLVTRQALYDYLPGGKYRVFFTVMAVAAAFYVLRAGMNYIVCYLGHTFGIRVEADIRRDLFRHLQEMSFDFYDRNRTGQLMSRLTSDLFELTELAHHGPEDLLTSAVTIVGALAVMASHPLGAGAGGGTDDSRVPGGGVFHASAHEPGCPWA